MRRVSFCDQSPKVKLIPGSAEQRGTDVRAAMRGHMPFRRCVYCSIAVSWHVPFLCSTVCLHVWYTRAQAVDAQRGVAAADG